MAAPAERSALRQVLGSTDARTFFAAAWLLAPLVELSLRLRGVERTLRSAELLAHAQRSRVPALPHGAAARLVAAAFRATPGLDGLCLARSIVQTLLHLRAGQSARLVIGVRRNGWSTFPPSQPPAAALRLDAHAWVEDPESLELPPGAPGFVPIASWDGDGIS